MSVPHLGALILTHTWNGAVQGLKSISRGRTGPPRPYVFWAFRVMVGLGLLMVAIGGGQPGCVHEGGCMNHAAALRVLAMAPAGFIAVLAGWTATEVGRQPFTVFGLLRTADSASPIGLPGVATSLVAFIVVYSSCLAPGSSFVLRLMQRPPTVGETGPQKGVPCAAPVSLRPPALLPEHRDRGGRRMTLASDVWAGLIAFAVLAYVLLDGFDLGVGILFAVEHGKRTAT